MKSPPPSGEVPSGEGKEGLHPCQPYPKRSGRQEGCQGWKASQGRGSGRVVWARLPLTAAKVVSGGPLVVGWSAAKVGLLPARPLRCYRCLERGHTMANWPCSKDRTDRCYRCGEQGHITKKCGRNVPNCPLCSHVGRRSDLVLESKNCAPQDNRRVMRESAPKAAQTSKRAAQSSPPPTGEEAFIAPGNPGRELGLRGRRSVEQPIRESLTSSSGRKGNGTGRFTIVSLSR